MDSNGTAENCVTSALASSPASNSPTFFIDLLSGINLQQYAASVFNALPCTGCVHELYKAAYVFYLTFALITRKQ